MTQFNNIDIKLSNSQLNKLKLGIKKVTEVTLNLTSNVICDFDKSFPCKLLLTDSQASRLCKAFINKFTN